MEGPRSSVSCLLYHYIYILLFIRRIPAWLTLNFLNVHEILPKIKKVTVPPWLHPVKIWLQTVSG